MAVKTNTYAVEMIDITKTFLGGKIVANDQLNLSVKANEIHALIGENGAGKSTLMSILFGLYTPDSGEIKVNGRPAFFGSAVDAGRAGLGMVHQHFKLIPDYTVLQNVILGNEKTGKLGSLDNSEAITKLNLLIQKYKLGLNLNAKVKDININQQQKVEILKLLYKDADILIFDEPTSVLNDYEIQEFLKMVKNFKAEGKTIILITHKLKEIEAVADAATVIRLGKTVGSFKIGQYDNKEISSMMVGRNVVQAQNKNRGQYDEKSQPILSVRDLSLTGSSNPFSFDVHKGEIFAIAGVEGNGQKELALQLTGLQKVKKGVVTFNGQDITHASVKKRYQKGISHIPEDNRGHGLILDLSITDNVVMQEISEKKFSTFGFLDTSATNYYASEVVHKFDVRGANDLTATARGLSGGNQQKLIVGREFERAHDLVIMVQPTKGLDVGAIQYIHNEVLKQKEQGKAVLLISYELDEIMSLCDTVAIISDDTLISIDNIKKTNRANIGSKIAGN